MAVSNNITTCLNSISLLLSIFVVATGVWLATKEETECLKFIRWPLILIGVILFFVSLAGFVGALWRVQSLLAVYLVCTFLLIIVLLIFVVFAFVVTHEGKGHSVPGRGYEEYQLSDFSGWFRHYVENSKHWAQIKACLSSSSICTRLNHRYLSAQDFNNAHLNPIESGCCKPPTVCGYSFGSATYWTNPVNQNADIDCILWSNDQTQLCYNCNSCKAGLLGDIKQKWKKINVILIVTLVALIWVYLIGCSAFRNAQTEDLFRRYKQGFGFSR